MSYGKKVVLDEIDLDIAHGQVVALLGPNGAGKTTTVEILEGFRNRSGGEVSVLGIDPQQAPESWRARVGVVLQSWRDHGPWRVRELLDVMGGYYAAYSTPEIRRPWPPGELLERVGLSDQSGQRIDRLSGGQRRRLDVAIGLAGRPELLFLDEPTTGLDPAGRRDVHDLIADLVDLDPTILMTTHDLDEAEKVADRLLILAGGGIVADGSPDALRLSLSHTKEVRLRNLETGEITVHPTPDPTAYLRETLAGRPDGIEVVEVRASSLEDIYLGIVRQYESSDAPPRTPSAPFAEPTPHPAEEATR